MQGRGGPTLSGMNRPSLVYWVLTGLFALAMTGSAVADFLLPPDMAAAMTHLGYPAYFATLLGAWKALGVVAILAPRFPRLKEWAYAGFFFDLSGAVYSHISSGDGPGVFAAPLILALLGLASWATRPADRRFGTILPG